MNSELEAIQKSLLALVQELLPDSDPAEVETVRQHILQGFESQGQVPPVDSPDFVPSSQTEAVLSQPKSLLNLGDVSAVQDRFQALVKRRLATEIYQNPPMFPWETEVQDYEDAQVFSTSPAFEPATTVPVPVQLWLEQLKSLIPAAMPEAVLAQLFQRCQSTLNSSLLEGMRLVRAVEDLFPDQSQLLHDLAGVVMTSTAPARSTATPALDYALSYDSALPPQQMVLSLLAAREIFKALTLTLSAATPVLERQWLTALGNLSLRAEYTTDISDRLRIQAHLPCGGSVTLRNLTRQSLAERSEAGTVSVELFDLELNHAYALEVVLATEPTLSFSVSVTESFV
jgi:hypothetical protein